VLVDGSVGLSTRLALISISGNNITANTLKTSGGSISLTTTDGKILLNGEANSSQQEVGTLASPNSSGTITFNVTGTGSIETYGAIDTRGRQGVNIVLITAGGATTIITQSGGSAGDVTLQAPEGNITVGSKIFAYGGNAVVDSLDRGESGTITIGAKNIAITQDQVGYYSTKFDINAQNNLIFAAVPNFTQPEESVGGTSIRMNQLEGGVVRPNDPVTRQDLSLVYGSTTTDGELYMGAGSTIVTAGGSFNAVRGKAPDPGVGGMTLGDIYTTGRGINSGSVLLGKAETKAPVTVSYINTTGGESTSDDTSAQDGLAGGNITVVGSEVRIGQILSSGSSPLDTAIIPAKGGNGGAISVSGDKISILGNLTTTGGAGNGATGVRSNGGAGGQITLTSTSTEGLVLDSLNLTTPTFVFDSSGGDGFNGANPGSAGRINLLGPISAAFGGVASQANTASTILTLQFTGLPPVSTVPLVKLGRDSGDLISLGTLVAGVDNDFTSGTVAINGRLSLANLNTVARRYNLEINGGGTISGLFTPLNTGYLKVGNAALETSFTGGLNGLTGPYEARLLGTISAPADSEGIVLGKIVLSGDTVLNTAGSVLALGTIDSETATPRNLDLNSASGDTTVSGAVGSALTLGSVHILSTGSTTFGSTVLANRMTTDAGSDVTFNENLTLTLSDVLNPSRFLGGVTFDNVAFSQGLSDDSLLVSGAGGKEFNQAVQLSNGPIEFGGSGQYTFAGDVSLATTSGLPVSMLLSGTSAKNFQGDVMVNEINQSLLSGKVTFQGDVTTSAMGTASSGASTFNSDVELAGITFTAGGATTFNTLTLSTGPVEFAGGDPASYLVKGLLTGGNQDLTISTTGGATFQAAANGIKSLTLAAGKGTTIFQGALGAATIEQVAGKGIVSFSENVNTTGDSDFQAGVVMGGNMIFTTGTGGKTTTFAATSTPSLNGNLTFAGAGDVIFNPALTGGNNVLTLSGLGARTFNSTVTAGSVVQDDGAGLLTFNKNVTANSVADPSELWNVALNAMTLGSKGSVQILGDVKSVGTVVLDAVNGITLGAGNNLLSEANSVFTLGEGDITMAADVSLNGAGNYVLSSKISDQGGGFSLLLAAGGSKTFNGDVTIQSMGQDDLSGTATFAGNVALVGNGQMDGNVILNGTGKTFASTGGSLAFGNAGTDTLTIQKSATLKTGAGQTLVVNGKIQMNGQLDLETGAAFLNQIAGTSSNLSLKLDDVDLAGTVALGSGSMTVKTLSAIPMSLGDNPLGLNLSKTELGLISTSAGVSVNDESGGGIFIDNLQLPDVQGITGPLRFISPNGVVAVMTPSVLRKLGVEAQDLVGLNNASFNEIAQLNLSAPSADVDINVAGGMAVTGSVDITGKAFLLTTAGRISASAPINAQRVEMTSAKSLSASGPLTAEDGVVLVSGSSLTTGKVNAGAGLVTMTGSGNVTINGAVSSLAGVTINPQGGYFINNAGGNVFDNATLAGGVRVVTKDIFSPNLSVGYANGLQVVYGVSDPALLAKNQIGVMDNFTDGNFAPLYFQFTTGTDQPYIFAQQTAIPLVRFPPSLSFAGGFRQAPRYSPEDLELLTPEERSAYEAAERQKSAKVMLQGNVGVQEVGRSSQSQPTSPQASRENAEEAGKKPTARVWLQGQPLARSQTDADRQDTTRLLKANHSRAVALRPPSVQGEDDILFGERISAEIGVVSLPVASQQ